MSDLTGFLLARIAGVESAARAATAGPWSHDHEGLQGGEVVRAGDVRVARVYKNGWPHYVPDCENAVHIARHDPARVLADVEAKRRIVKRLEQAERLVQANAEKLTEVSRGGLDWEKQEQIGALRTHGWELAGRRDALLYVADELAATYADHPDYRSEWQSRA